jgi:hypothetical protein
MIGPNAEVVEATPVARTIASLPEQPAANVDVPQTVEPAPHYANAVTEPAVPPVMPPALVVKPAETPAPENAVEVAPPPAMVAAEATVPQHIETPAAEDHAVPAGNDAIAATEKANAEPTPEEPIAATPASEVPLTAPLPAPESTLLARLTPLPHSADPGLPAKLDSQLAPSYPDTGMKPVPIVGGMPSDAIAETPQPDTPRWHAPTLLLENLQSLTAHPATNRWAEETIHLVNDLGRAVEKQSDDRLVILGRLDQVANTSSSLAAATPDRDLAQKLFRAGFALQRRVALWKQLVRFENTAMEAESPAVNPQVLSLCLNELDHITSGSSEGTQWRNYLLLDALKSWSAAHNSPQDRIPAEMARRLLARLHRAALLPAQRQFITDGPVAILHTELLRHLAEPVDMDRFLGHVERYEASGRPSDARLVREDCQYLSVGNEAQQELVREVDRHYRNANLRVAIAADLLNRLMPNRKPEYAEVNDSILGYPVQGDSVTSSSAKIRLLPDPQRVRLALEITGDVTSLTTSMAGPATFVHDGDSRYLARKPMEIDLSGIRLWPTEVEVDHQSQLRQMRTDFDKVPLFNMVVRSVALGKHEDSQSAADEEVKQKVSAKAQQRIDAETGAQLRAAAQRLREKVLEPMDRLAIEPTLVAAETTPQRFIMRLRLASRDQLGGHTPRPVAPADSSASIQVHESALNNVLERLELNGRMFTMPQLSEHVARTFNRALPADDDPEHQEVHIRFAKDDAVRVRCRDGKVEITLAVASLSKGPRQWSNFLVRAYYRPEVRGRSVEMVRDGVVQLQAEHLATGGQIALRGAFSKTFAKRAPWQIIPTRLTTDPRLADLAITQFVIEDGWVGIALGPQRTAAHHGLLLRR